MAIDKAKNTSMQDKSVSTKEEGDEYFFSEHQITVIATSPEEAEKKLQAVIKKKK